MKIAIGCDHGGVELKAHAKDYLKSKGYDFEDYGTFDARSCDYNDIAEKVAEAVVSGKADRGVLFCGTGIGMSIVANKVKGARCAHCHDVFSAKMTRLHNDANIVAMGERVIGAGLMLEILEAFLTTEFSGEERHVRRVDKIRNLEEKNFK